MYRGWIFTGLFVLMLLSSASVFAKGQLKIAADRDAALVYIDGRKAAQLGEGYTSIMVSPGNHTITVRTEDGPKPGWVWRARREIFVGDGTVSQFTFELRPYPRKVQAYIQEQLRDIRNDMVTIEGDDFLMGCINEQQGCGADEKPVHQVLLRGFKISQYEVTFAQWDACYYDGGCSHRPDDEGWGRGARPVMNVSWDDVQEFISWLRRKSGLNYRLPSEAEWEYAARAGEESPYSTGRCISTTQANFDGDYGWDEGCCTKTGLDRSQTMPVGSFDAKLFGLYDMHGNVYEWVQDCWHDTYNDAPIYGKAWTTGGNCSRRVLRGGSWYGRPRLLRSAARNWGARSYRSNLYGFRLVR